MSQVVQAACPGCRSVLRIPTNYLGQAIRCKKCGALLKTKAPEVASTVTAPPPPAPQASSPIAPAPLAKHVSPSFDPASPFAFDEFDEEPVRPTTRRRRRRGSPGWLAIATCLVIFGMTASAGYFVFTKVIHGENPTTSQDDDKAGARIDRDESASVAFPRRALLISIHNYLYANPIDAGSKETPNLDRLQSSLNRGLRVSLDQMIHLSDVAKKDPRPPLKSVIEETLSNFLKTTRAQDRILVFFVGHTREIDNEAFLVPLEGELDDPKTLIPMKWVYDQLKQCPARQKVFVLDGNRFNPGQGTERPASGPMSPKFEEALQNPPEGVQVWSACRAGQQSNEFEDSALGLFLDSLRLALTPEKGSKGALDGTIQKHDDLLPLEALNTFVQSRMERVIERRKAGKQVALLAGKAPADGVAFDRNEAPARTPALPNPPTADLQLVKSIMDEISVPPLKSVEHGSDDLPVTLLPRFPENAMKGYQESLPADSKLREAIRKARATLWAASLSTPPENLKEDVQEARKSMRFDLSVMRDRFGIPPPAGVENFKTKLLDDLEPLARIIMRLENSLDELKRVQKLRDSAPKRWQANYDFMVARCQATLAYVEEYAGQLGLMRKDLPEHDPKVHVAFRLASTEKATDSSGKKLERAARKAYAELAKENPNTLWEVLAKREKLTALGLTWTAQ